MVKINNTLTHETIKKIRVDLEAGREVGIPVMIDEQYHLKRGSDSLDGESKTLSPDSSYYYVNQTSIGHHDENPYLNIMFVSSTGIHLSPNLKSDKTVGFTVTAQIRTEHLMPDLYKVILARLEAIGYQRRAAGKLRSRFKGYARFSHFVFFNKSIESSDLAPSVTLEMAENESDMLILLSGRDELPIDSLEKTISLYLMFYELLIDATVPGNSPGVKKMRSISLSTEAPIVLVADTNRGGLAPQKEVDIGTTKQLEEKRATVRQLSRALSVTGRTMPFDSIGGCYDAKLELLRIAYGLKHPEVFKKWGSEFPKGILLTGPPGTGKTQLVKAMAATAGIPVQQASADNILSRWWGESEKKIGELFDSAKKHAPSIILFDEIDALCIDRDQTDHNATATLTNTILSRMDGLRDAAGIIVIGTTNRPAVIDKAFLRPGRFDKQILVPLPDYNDRIEIWYAHLHGKRTEQIDYARLASESAGMSGADIFGVVKTALDNKINRDISISLMLRKGGEETQPISTQDLLELMANHSKVVVGTKAKQKT